VSRSFSLQESEDELEQLDEVKMTMRYCSSVCYFIYPLCKKALFLVCYFNRNSTVHPVACPFRCADLDLEECTPPLPRIWIVWVAVVGGHAGGGGRARRLCGAVRGSGGGATLPDGGLVRAVAGSRLEFRVCGGRGRRGAPVIPPLQPRAADGQG
jgi:hypothetical protein